MNVLWITNNMLPDLCVHLGAPVVNKTGWLHSAANQVKSDVNLSVAALYDGANEVEAVRLNDVNYILVPSGKMERDCDAVWKRVSQLAEPDVVHIHGTEYPTGLGYLKACGADNVLISIQGLISQVAECYNFGLGNRDILKYTTVRDVVKNDTLWKQAARFVNAGKVEREYLRLGSHFIGRTGWDRAHIMLANEHASYHFNNETLRDAFYTSGWSLEKARRNSIFFSQSTYPLKGLHMLLKAMPHILKYYPDTVIHVAGFDLTKKCASSVAGKIKATTYGYYLYSLIRNLGLQEHISFLGNLSETAMRDAYLNAHVYVNASALENSSNSIGEAQLLGVPVVASFVGGTDTIVENDKTGLLYPAEDVTRLAARVIELFGNDELAVYLSENERKVAHARHDKIANKERLIEIYREVGAKL